MQILGFAYALGTFSTISSSLFAVHAWLQTLIKINGFLVFIQISLLIILIQKYALVGASLAIAITEFMRQLIFFGVAMNRLQITLIAVVSKIWRSLAGSAVMAFVLYRLGLGWTNTTAPTTMGLGIQLMASISIGAITYTLSVLVLWLASGRPDGPEQEILNQLKSFAKRFRSAR